MRNKTYLIVGVLLIGTFGVFTACSKSNQENHNESSSSKKVYTCPMHPQYTSDKPGDCPICHMRLVLKEDSQTPQRSSGERKIKFYRNPMNPEATSQTPMKDEMGMDYLPVYEEGSDGSNVSGQSTVNILPGREQLIGIKTSPVETRDLFSTVRASARVAYDPALYSAILEYKEALASLRNSQQQDTSSFRKEAKSTIQASKLRLRQMGLSDQQIDQFTAPGSDPANLLLGQAGGTVWVYVDIYDYEAGLVKRGQRAEFNSPAFPGVVFKGIVKAVDSVVNKETRTLRARVEVPNPQGELKPEMYLNGQIFASIGKKLAIPETALIDTGMRQLVYVEKQPGQYEPTEIKTGQHADKFIEVLSGLKEGDKVVTSANFLVDSESKLKAIH